MEGEHKIVDYKFEESSIKISVDPNKDGEPLIKLELNLKEVLDEAISFFTKKKEGEA